MKKLVLSISGLALLSCLGFVAGSSNPKNVVIALGPWEGAPAEIVGVLSGQQWLENQNAAKLIVGGESIRLFSHTGVTGKAKVGKPESLGAPCEETFGVGLTPTHKAKAFEIGVTGTWNPRPRAMTVLPNNSVPYLKIAKDFLVQKGLKNPVVKLTSLLKTDFDNDKSDEVFLVGRHFQESSSGDYFPPVYGKKGDYSFVLMRKIVNGKVQTISLGDDVLLKDIEIDSDTRHLAQFYDIAGLLDLNHDGTLELVSYGAYYEGYSFEILEWNGTTFVSRAVSGCGA
jgi:hypothetical protein